MANYFVRLYHDMPNDPKWRTIARASGQKVALVQAVYLQLLVDASRNVTRGHVTVTLEDIASALDERDEDVKAVLDAMNGRVMADGRLTGWDKRNPIREDDGNELTGAKSATQRKRDQRERERLERESREKYSSVTQCHNESRNVTTDKDKDKDKEEIKTSYRGKREADPRHTPFREILDQAWKAKNPKIEMPWDAGAAKQLASLLSANPTLTTDAFRSMLRNRHKSEVNHAESPKSFLPRLTDFAGGPLDRFNKPFDKTDVIAFKPITIAEQLAKQRQGA